MLHVKRIISLFALCVVICSCAIMEQSIEESPEKNLPRKPEIASTADSVQVFKAKSAIQRSSEYLLAGYTVYKNGKFYCEISPEELKVIGIIEADYKKYVKHLARLNEE